jgi:hypothetical protein
VVFLVRDEHEMTLVKQARNQLIYEAVRFHEHTLEEGGDFLGLYYSTISVIAKRVDEEKKHQK